jgi:two-component system, cell cycle sensor histidine kinase and response regulator CckA
MNDSLSKELVKFKFITENIREEVYLVNPDGLIIYANESAINSLGYSREKLLGSAITDIDSYLGNKSGGRSDFFLRLKQQGTISFETLHKSKNGAKTFKQINAVYFSEEGLELAGLFAHDISSTMQSKLDLMRSEERFRDLFEQSSDGIFIVNKNGKIVEWNEKIETLTGIRKIDAVDKNAYDVYQIVSPQYPDTLAHGARKILDIFESISKNEIKDIDIHESVEMTIFCTDGSKYLVQHMIFPISNPAEKGYLLGNIVRDISDRARLEDERIRTQKFESLGILAGGIAHDFRNILSAILGNVTLALRGTDENSRQFKFLRNAETAVLHAKELTGRLLTFSKGGDPVKTISSVKEIIEESAALSLSGSNIRCEYSFKDEIPQILVDRVQIIQTIQNIMINAIQSMHDGGKISIATEKVDIGNNEIPLLVKGTYVSISFTDAGTGIPEENIKKIFDPYFSTKKSGTGLGLSVAFSVIRKHGGTITAESTLGKGSVFTIYLPLDSAVTSRETKKETVSCAPSSGSGNILIIDDDEAVLETTRELLQSIGYCAETVKTIEESIPLYKLRYREKKPFKAVIMDLTIPGSIGGQKGIKLLLKKFPSAKVIVTSGYSNNPVLANFAEYGFVDALIKPIEIVDLSRILGKIR